MTDAYHKKLSLRSSNWRNPDVHHWYATKREEKDTWFRCQCGLEMIGADLYHEPVPEEKGIWPI
jgi:hypothetical protein